MGGGGMLLVWSWGLLLGSLGTLKVRWGSRRPLKAVLGSRLSRGLIESRRRPTKAWPEASGVLIKWGPLKPVRTIKALLGLVKPGAVPSRTIRPVNKKKYEELTGLFTIYYIVIITVNVWLTFVLWARSVQDPSVFLP